MEKVAEEMLSMLKSEGEEGAHIAYGTIVGDIKEVSKSYKEAKLALDVGKIFFEEKDIIAYSALGIGRLIYQLPIRCARCLSVRFLKGSLRTTSMRRH